MRQKSVLRLAPLIRIDGLDKPTWLSRLTIFNLLGLHFEHLNV